MLQLSQWFEIPNRYIPKIDTFLRFTITRNAESVPHFKRTVMYCVVRCTLEPARKINTQTVISKRNHRTIKNK